ncbi:putative ATP-dependent RNA helicase DDX56, partial [Fragariocoptes setiger]
MADADEEHVEFYEMGLDDRLLKAISLLGWSRPTLIQEKAIPLALEGHDILARARTGSGKTAVFAIPVIDKILKERQKNPSDHHKTQALIVVPSKELSKQIYTHVTQLTSCCSREVRIIDVASSEVSDLRPLLVAEPPDILVGTPSKLLAHIAAGTVKNLKSTVKYFVVDEADLLFSFGFEADIQQLIERSIPEKGCQSYLLSATLNSDVINLKSLVLHRPVVIRLDEPELPECAQLSQYHIKCEEEEKFVLINALMKLNLIQGRTIIFVRSLTRCYKLKIFLELFAIKSCVLNPELPVSTRCNIVERFNTGVYDIIIACDEKCVHDPTETLKSKGNKKKLDRDYVISRGIDFQSVTNVINFDFPSSVTAYIHRVGRTARAINANNAAIEEGTVLSFISRDEIRYFEKVQKSFEGKATFKPYAFKMEELEAFRYRARDALRAVTKGVIHEARAKEIKQEIKNSERLKSFMTQNPTDAKILRHDKTLRNVRLQTHLKDMPDYIVPPTLLSRKRQISRGDEKRIENEIEVTAPSSRKKKKKVKSKSKPFKHHRTQTKSKKKFRKKSRE